MIVTKSNVNSSRQLPADSLKRLVEMILLVWRRVQRRESVENAPTDGRLGDRMEDDGIRPVIGHFHRHRRKLRKVIRRHRRRLLRQHPTLPNRTSRRRGDRTLGFVALRNIAV